MVYDEGIEINFGKLSFFFFFKYGRNLDESSSDCEVTLNGSDKINLNNFEGFLRKKTESKSSEKYILECAHAEKVHRNKGFASIKKIKKTNMIPLLKKSDLYDNKMSKKEQKVILYNKKILKK